MLRFLKALARSSAMIWSTDGMSHSLGREIGRAPLAVIAFMEQQKSNWNPVCSKQNGLGVGRELRNCTFK